MGTVLFGQTSEDQAAEELARRSYRYDPFLVKKSRTLFGSMTEGFGPFRRSVPVPTGEQITEFTKGEHVSLWSGRMPR